MSLDRQGAEELGDDISIEKLFYPLYRRLFGDDSDFVRDIEKKLGQARMASNVELYIARALAIGVLTGLALLLLGLLVGWIISELIIGTGPILGVPLPDSLSIVVELVRSPVILVITALLFGGIGFAIGFGAMLMRPYLRSSERKREINTLLPDTIAFMYALSVGGMNQLEIVRATARADDTYGEVAKEFQSIVLETEYFDTDYRTAVRNQAIETPSGELAQFLTDMLSILDSGGDMTRFLEDQKDKHIRTAKQEQQKQLDTLELFGEMYMTLSLFPLLLIIILVIMSMMGGGGGTMMLYLTVYALIPLIGFAFLVMVSTVTQDEFGDGYLREEGSSEPGGNSLDFLNTDLAENYTGEYGIFDQIRSREGRYEFQQILRAPHLFFREYPLMVLLVTVPLNLFILVGLIATGNAPLSVGGLQDQVIWGTFVWIYLPIYINLIPLAIFHEWNVRSRRAILGGLSENLRKLASANDTGMTLLESLKMVADTSSGKLSNEFDKMYAKVNYGTSLKDALREFNNDYHIPRLARTVKLVSEAQETSSHIQDVLTTAATTSENQDDIERERRARTLMQLVIIIMTYLTLLAVMALLQVQFLDTMTAIGGEAAEDGGGATDEFIGDLDADFLSMLFFHAVTIQALISAIVAGYIRNVDLISGAKYAVFLATTALITWVFVEQFTGDVDPDDLGFLLLLATGCSVGDIRRRIHARLFGDCDEVSE